MSTANSTTTLTPAELVEARALRDELLSTRDLAVSFYGAGAGAEARATVRELLSFAAEWDAQAEAQRVAAYEWADLMARAEAGQLADPLAAILTEADPAPQASAPAPTATAHERARAKAAYNLAGGLELRRAGAAWLVPSGSRGGTVHRVEAGQCSCEAGQHGRACWHVEAVAQVEASALAPMAA